jgi:iron complex outermembrane receptor protein
VDRDLYLPGVPPYTLAGGSGFDSEEVLAYELGYRVRPMERLTLSLSGFFNKYYDIRSLSTNALSNNAYVFGNDNRAEEWGLELSGTWQVNDWWRWRGGYTYLHKHVFVAPGGSDLNHGRAEGNDPDHQFVLQSMMSLPWNMEFDGVFRYVSSLPSPPVPSYFAADLRLAWHPRPNLELAIVGQNLVDSRHAEFGAAPAAQEIPRSVYGKITWRF